ncbi:unnamed protein product [Zymoseptoria tritici ST99CH_1A5]|uniref:Uncharacterized protein n=1 Tax=Zymoseptoria tritici ST99CH_1A5 TaxID=1276529 RepID=A0A1Y6M324_ZYMTR|nr:unnamed protein product [Zymoseptoria tritici ST99CH_1A5]
MKRAELSMLRHAISNKQASQRSKGSEQVGKQVAHRYDTLRVGRRFRLRPGRLRRRRYIIALAPFRLSSHALSSSRFKDQHAKCQVPKSGYVGINAEIDNDFYDYEFYHCQDDLKYGDDAYWGETE